MTDREARWRQRFQVPMLVAALASVPAIVIENSDLAAPWPALAAALNWVIWSAFLVELVVMLAVTDDRARWLRRHPLEVAIVVLTPPFGPAALQGARALRLLRLLRLVRLAVLARELFSLDGIRWALVLGATVVLGGGAAYAAIEGGEDTSAWDGIWWAITTVTTVGYGDSFPRTDAGRVIAIFVMLVGIGLVALLTAAAADRFIRGRAARDEAERAAGDAAILARLDQLTAEVADLRRQLERRP